MNGAFSRLPAAGFIAAEALSLLGSQVAAVAIPILVLRETGSPLAVALAGVAATLPVLLAALVGGGLIDSVGARRISLTSDVLSAVSVLALPSAYLILERVPFFLLFMLVLLGALFDPTGVAARQTLVPQVASRSRLPLERINAWRGALENGADFLGPGVAGLLIAFVGALGALYLNAGTFIVCAGLFALSVTRSAARSPGRPEPATLAGVRFLWQNRELRALTLSGGLVGLVLLPFLGVLLPVVAIETFRSSSLLALSLSGFGLAATGGAASFSRLSRHFSRSTLYYGGILVTALAIGLCALSRTPLEVVLAATLAGLVLGAGNPLQQTVLQEHTPEAVAGRVFTSFTALQFLGGPLGLVLAGWAAQRFSVTLTLALSSGLLLGVATLGWLALPLRQPAT